LVLEPVWELVSALEWELESVQELVQELEPESERVMSTTN
jgi:hypothetical protein